MDDKTLDDMAGDDLIDSRDLANRLEDLRLKREDDEEPALDEDETAELDALAALEDLGVADWQYGETFIRDSYFEEYARDLADEIGAVDSDAGWPTRHIDWKAAADELRQDYTDATIGGYDYLVRA